MMMMMRGTMTKEEATEVLRRVAACAKSKYWDESHAALDDGLLVFVAAVAASDHPLSEVAEVLLEADECCSTKWWA